MNIWNGIFLKAYFLYTFLHTHVKTWQALKTRHTQNKLEKVSKSRNPTFKTTRTPVASSSSQVLISSFAHVSRGTYALLPLKTSFSSSCKFWSSTLHTIQLPHTPRKRNSCCCFPQFLRQSWYFHVRNQGHLIVYRFIGIHYNVGLLDRLYIPIFQIFHWSHHPLGLLGFHIGHAESVRRPFLRVSP